MRPVLGHVLRPGRPRLTARRAVGLLVGVPLAGLVVIVAGAHLGWGPLHGTTALRDRLFGAGGQVALIGSSVPGAQPGGGYGSPASAAGSGGSTVVAQVKNLDDYFDPQVLRVAPGTTVEFHNDGRNPHTVTADDGSYDSGVLQDGQVFSHTYTTPGVYPFNCKLHGGPGGIGMSGIIVVGDVPLPQSGGQGAVGPGREPVPTSPGTTIHVPLDQPTIQQGVDAASPGDLVLVAPGVYHEAVLVRTPYVTIRGEDRNTTVLDGDFTRPNGIHVVEADGVAVENMTARHYQLNGFYWAGVNGYRGSYLTAYGNGDYGIYAFDSVWGRFDHSYAAGQPDSGFYIGQCDPCHALVEDVVSTHNALGYSGTNAGGDLVLANSEWVDNLAGIVPNTLDSERLAPQHAITIEGNWVHANAAVDAPTKRLEYPTYGIGIVAAGGRDNLIAGNLVEDNPTFGIALLPNLDDNLWLTQGNVVRDNVVRGSGRADLAMGALSTGGDCFSGNAYTTSMPPAIELWAGCGHRFAGGGEAGATFSLLARFATALGGHWTGGDWRTEPQPPDQAQMPGALTAAPVLAVPETAVPGPVAVRTMGELEAAAAAGTQAGPPASAPAPAAREVMILGIPLASGMTTVLGLYGYILPFVLYAAWMAISLWDLVRREDITDRRRYAWMTATLLVPFAGPVLYLVGGGSAIKRGVRLYLVFGAMALYLVIAAATFLLEALG
jgi:plastocyanin